MTRILVFIVCFVSCERIDAKEHIMLNPNGNKGIYHEVLSDSAGELVLRIIVNDFYLHPVKTGQDTFYSVSAAKGSPALVKGAPDLPKYAVSIALAGPGMEATVIATEFREYHQVPLAPSRGNLTAEEMLRAGYIYGSAYEGNEYWPSSLIESGVPYRFRHVRGQTLSVFPFSYQASTQTLKVCLSLTVRINYSGNTDVKLNIPARPVSKEMQAIIHRHFINSPQVYAPVEEEGDLLIFCPSSWSHLMQPFIEWKKMRGIPVTLVETDSAITADYIKQYIESFYNSHTLTHVLLAGDDPFIPAYYPAWLSAPSDPSYGFVEGTDAYPEVFIGRFPAESDTQLVTMINRVITYERNPDTTSTWYSHAVGVAGNFGPGDDNEMDWEHLASIRSDLMNYTYQTVHELYDGTHPSTTDLPGNPVAGDLMSVLQSGVGLMNYTGHGTNAAWGTTGFSIFNVPSLNNSNRLPFIWTAGCMTGHFTLPTPSLAESLLRAENGGAPVGAIATLMSSVDQFWSPPMDAQDEMNAILTESDTANIKRSFGGISFNGCMHMNDNYGHSGELMTAAWHCFGDPTLQVRTAQPFVIQALHNPALQIGDAVFSIFCNAEGALAVLLQKGEIISTSQVVNGMALPEFLPLLTNDSVTIAVTAFNGYPYITTIPVVQPAGQYIIAKSISHSEIAGNGNGIPENNEILSGGVVFYNAGASASGSFSYQIVSQDSLVNVVNGTGMSGFLASGDSIYIPAAVEYETGSVDDEYVQTFNITATDSAGTYSSYARFSIMAPVLHIKKATVDDASGNANGVLDPGESGSIIVEIKNTGHASAYAAIARLTGDTLLNVLADSAVIGQMDADSSVIAAFPVSLSSSAQAGNIYSFTAVIRAGDYADTAFFSMPSGRLMEDFETGDFSAFNWQFSGNMPWTVTTYAPYQGLYCSQSGEINDSERSVLRLELQCLIADSITFMYKVSSEPVWDGLYLNIDSIYSKGWSGNVPWTYDGVLMNPGNHILDFIYSKDNIISGGMDCAWLDDIRFPPHTVVTAVGIGIDADLINVYPVPSSGTLNIINGTESLLTLDVYDATGAILLFNKRVQENLKLDITNLQDGVYFLRLKARDTIYIKKFVVSDK